jgi:CheY-like chemotaxis protein
VDPRADKPMDTAHLAMAGIDRAAAHDSLDALHDETAPNRRPLESDRMARAGRAAVAMVHDFNNILNNIGCIVDVLLLEQPEDSQCRTDLEEIKKATHRGAALTRQLLSLGRGSSGLADPVDPSELKLGPGQGQVRAADATEPSAESQANLVVYGNQPIAATVLLVDDEDAARTATRRILMSEGYHVIEADSVRRALDVSLQYSNEIDLLLTDVMLPDSDGGALFAELHKLRPRLRVLFLTGCGREVLDRHQLQANEYNIVEKPCRRAKIIEGVRHALG